MCQYCQKLLYLRKTRLMSMLGCIIPRIMCNWLNLLYEIMKLCNLYIIWDVINPQYLNVTCSWFNVSQGGGTKISRKVAKYTHEIAKNLIRGEHAPPLVFVVSFFHCTGCRFQRVHLECASSYNKVTTYTGSRLQRVKRCKRNCALSLGAHCNRTF